MIINNFPLYFAYKDLNSEHLDFPLPTHFSYKDKDLVATYQIKGGDLNFCYVVKVHKSLEGKYEYFELNPLSNGYNRIDFNNFIEILNLVGNYQYIICHRTEVNSDSDKQDFKLIERYKKSLV